ncbi:MAG: 3-hydroxyacyl-ACP dehydratase FabZ [Oscillospiraceae bacterium]|jgi:3-hydroxyacyl-[acyl-carrier-protein] dehydratase|nr:3-hydroxyacyl-ACP dehydratase FabZ [Oscillospiraceae bacterium]
MTLTIDEIRDILPHRYPFLLIDRVEECEPGKFARAIKCVTANEPFFEGHFPGYSVMPGVLILEALAQTGAVALLSEPENRGKIALFGGVKQARFRTPVVPGDVLTLTCTLTRRMGNVGMGEAAAYVGEKLACSAELSFAVMQGIIKS